MIFVPCRMVVFFSGAMLVSGSVCVCLGVRFLVHLSFIFDNSIEINYTEFERNTKHDVNMML